MFLKLAGDAINQKMFKSALSFYQLIPSSKVAIDDLRAQIESMGALPRITDATARLDKAKLEAQLKALEAEANGPKSVETVRLAGTAYLQETLGNPYGAYGCYLLLEEFYPKAEKREDNLYQLFRLSSIIGKDQAVLDYGDQLTKRYPNSKYIPDVQKLLLSSLFFNGEYERVIDTAKALIDGKKVEENTEGHDIASFMLGASYFYTGQFEEVDQYIDKHVKLYPKSQFAMPAEYIQASNATRLQLWAKAGKLLDQFLAKYKDSPDKTYIPLALFDRANAYYSEEQIDGTLKTLDRLTTEFPTANIVDQAYNLKANALQSEENFTGAEESYKQALATAEERNNSFTAGESLYYLISLIVEQSGDDKARMKEAAAYADTYWEKYADGSPYRSQVAIAQLPVLEAVGRYEDGLKRLEGIISEMAKLSVAPGLEDAINAYTEAYLKQHTPEELKDHYYNFPNIGLGDKAARAILRIAIIGVFEGVNQNSKEANKQRAAKAMIQVLFQNLKSDFALKDLSNYILVKLGDYLRTNTSTPLEALPFYDEALNRSDKSYRFKALSGRADVYGNSSSKADLDKAMKDFELIYSESDDKGEREFALFRIIEILMKKGDFQKAADQANVYLNRDEGKSLGFNKYSAEVGLMLADSFRERKQVDDAIAMYVKVWSTHMGNIKISAPAVKSWMELSYQRNKKSSDANVASDRQGAYNGGWRYIDLTSRFKDKFEKNPEELNPWKEVEALVNKYEADANVKSMEQIQKEKEDAKK